MDDRFCGARPARGDVYLSELDVDETDFAFLSAARYFCVAFSDGDRCAWVAAILGSDCFFAGKDCAEKMRRALAVVHEMRTSRRSVFQFSNPRCQKCSSIVTQDERYLLQLVQSTRQGRTSNAASSAMLLCEGNAIEGVMAAARAFAKAVEPKKTAVDA